MSFPVRRCLAVSLSVMMAAMAAPVQAGSSVEESLALSLSNSIRERSFWNLHVVSTKTKTKSEEPRDMFPGGVVSIADLVKMRNAMAAELPSLNDPSSPSYNPELYEINSRKLANVYAYGYAPSGSSLNAISALTLLESSLVKDYGFTPGVGTTPGNGYLGTPKGILAKASDPSPTVALSVGHFLDDGHNWAVEALLLGAPVRAKVYGDGVNDKGEPNALVGQRLINTKMLPPVVKLGYYFGDKNWPVRPYVGVGAMYAIFFDTKATNYFNEYQGGKTSVSIKNSFGMGPFVGLESSVADSGWRVGVSIGKIKLKTEATLVTRGTMINSFSKVTGDYGTQTSIAIEQGDALLGRFAQEIYGNGYQVFQPYPGNGPVGTTGNKYQVTTELMKDLAAYRKKYEGGDGSLGTFVRKQKTELDNTIFMFSVGRAF